MENASSSNLDASTSTDVDPFSPPADSRFLALSTLLKDLDEAPILESPSSLERQNQLIQIRLGIASSLFTALRIKHPPTACHSLRVAMGCSSWSWEMDISEQQRDEIEIAALLHDIGKIGVPDDILRKPGTLTQDEANVMDRHRQSGREIMAACCASPEILEVIGHVNAWFDGTRAGFALCGKDIPLGARMIAIVDAFDSMTTDHVYRKAKSRERAIAELFEFASTQFDPDLVRKFGALSENDRVKLDSSVARRWLQQLSPDRANWSWQLNVGDNSTSNIDNPEKLFSQKLLENMHDGVVFVDENLRILHWNQGAERLTGIPARSVTDKQWLPDLVYLRDGEGRRVKECDCPVLASVRSGSQSVQRLTIKGRHGGLIAVDAHAVPVIAANGATYGATLLLHDVSSERSLEERVQRLHEKATRDPLTQVANRAEFDRLLVQYAQTHLDQSLPCSLIMCDIDRFKLINDNYGHQAGDEALISFASLLKRSCRRGDLVARYGGEEFAIVCADCGNASATDRAEQLRKELSRMPLAVLGGRSLTASFGVTELQPGDSAETMLRRADRALLQAKDNGRNRVVQLGAGMDSPTTSSRRGWWAAWWNRSCNQRLLERHLIMSVPINVAAEKLRGFVADHNAEIVSIEDNHVVLRTSDRNIRSLRRRDDRPLPFVIDLVFEERRLEMDGLDGHHAPLRTTVHVVMRPQRNRDRRSNAQESARQLLASLKSYLMAQDCDDHREAPGKSIRNQ